MTLRYRLRRFRRLCLAWFRLDLRVVCEESARRSIYDDFHDYPDSTFGEPWHFVVHTCKRCGKKFVI